VLHGVADGPLQGILALAVRPLVGTKLTQKLVCLLDRGQIVLSGLGRLYLPDKSLQTDIFRRKCVHEAGNVHVFLHDDGGLTAEAVKLYHHHSYQGPKGGQDGSCQKNNLGPDGNCIPFLA
jgi:hypothetical protein